MHRGGREEVQTEADITQTIQCLCLAQLKKNFYFRVKWKVYCLFDKIKSLVMFDEENKTETSKKLKTHKKSSLGTF